MEVIDEFGGDPLVISSLRGLPHRRGVPANQTLALLGSEPDEEPVNDSLRVKRTLAKARVAANRSFAPNGGDTSWGSCSRLKRYIRFKRERE